MTVYDKLGVTPIVKNERDLAPDMNVNKIFSDHCVVDFHVAAK